MTTASDTDNADNTNKAGENPVLQLDIISDVICPWCYIGKRKLDAALASLGDVPVNLMWRPFQLDPATPSQGYDRQKQMRAKFGADGGKHIMKNIMAVAEGTGINFAFDKITRTPNTMNAHRLIRWAASTGLQHQVAETLFSRYFEQGQDIGETEVLLDIAAAHDMDTALIARLLASDADIEQTRNDDAAARDLGVTGVPGFLVGGKMLVVGAQEPETLARFFQKAQSKLAQQNQAAANSAN